MVSRGDLVFQVLDLPPEGIGIHGEVEFADLGIHDDGVSVPTPLSFALNVSPVQDGVLVGSASGFPRVCDCCLNPVRWPWTSATCAICSSTWRGPWWI